EGVMNAPPRGDYMRLSSVDLRGRARRPRGLPEDPRPRPRPRPAGPLPTCPAPEARCRLLFACTDRSCRWQPPKRDLQRFYLPGPASLRERLGGSEPAPLEATAEERRA